ncbi:MAG: J domain-containing protein [Verrucomicrobiota bacterium]|jgi:DnaJ-class molecular chaperone
MNDQTPNDYYQTLGIRSDADLDAIKRAYRKRAMECHPDRGGSHEAMLLINEAFQILSNPETRSRYDAVRTGQASQQADADRNRARESAGNYPRDWTSFQTWLDAIYNDFARANYNPHEPVGKSVSGQTFKFIGGFTGLMVGIGVVVLIVYCICCSSGSNPDSDTSNTDSHWNGLFVWLAAKFAFIGIKEVMIVGMCVALAFHKAIRREAALLGQFAGEHAGRERQTRQNIC